ncbi:hypothetical protein TH63_01640 [Rufibacter radiotolerans]|uniref:Thymidylate kinase n=1 Tax=Rufibacter radiotolerans TaxID=1379910 RepID=A0A0H4VH72_9BACT|nr:hypothetical protein TH63_01640 [Rufibacter radiotolerans]
MYCHWKSNENLSASMLGDTDLDILFDTSQKDKVLFLLKELDFRKFSSLDQKQYKDIEDYIGFDSPSGKVVHVHAHFRLTMGENYLKGYQLTFEDQILQTRVFNSFHGIYHSHPAFELILLYFREALKLRTRDLFLIYLFNKTSYTGRLLQEYKWLKANATQAQVVAMLQGIVSNYYPILNLILHGTNRKDLFQLSRLVRAEFRNNKLYSPVSALFSRWYREVMVRTLGKLPKLLDRPMVSRRINPRGGLTVAFLGADGSGKSTVTANLRKTFQQKLDVYSIYFGRGDGTASWARTVLSKLKKAVVPARKKTGKVQKTDPAGLQKEGFLANLYRCVEALLVAQEKKTNLRRMQEAKQMGMLVICDRFPQNQIKGFNDGPLLHHLVTSGNLLFRAMARYEANLYASVKSHSPDLIFKLIADAQVVEARKPGDVSLPKLEAKIAGIKELRFGKNSQVITIDAAQPLSQVLTTVKQEIWKAYA